MARTASTRLSTVPVEGFDITVVIGHVQYNDVGDDAFHVAMRLIAEDALSIKEGDRREYQFLGATVTVAFDGYGA